MNWIDIIIIVILGISLISGFATGFVKEISSLIALILGVWGSIKFSSFTADKLYEWFGFTGGMGGLVAFIVTFLIIILLVHLFATAIDKVIKAASLGIVNKLLGALFSAMKTVLVLSVVFVVINAFDEHFHFMPEKTVEESSLYSPIADIVPAIFPTLGEGGLIKSFERLRESVEDQE